MAHSNSFFGLRRGSTKSHTYSVLKGQQVTKDRVSEVSNPRSNGQMTQRAGFSSAIKFYKSATKNLFVFAFEDKKARESDYNAFMRHNAKLGMIVTREQYDNINYPAIGEFELTHGSMQQPRIRSVQGDDQVVIDLLATASEAPTTAQALADVLATGYELATGDIITLVSVKSTLEDITDEPGSLPRWNIAQVIVGASSDERTIANLSTALGITLGATTSQMTANLDADHAGAFAIIFSRNTPSGLKVSTSVLQLNDVAKTCLRESMDPRFREGALNSWGATGIAILQGALAPQPAQVLKSITKGVIESEADSATLTYSGFAMPESCKSGDYAMVVMKQGDNQIGFMATYKNAEELEFANEGDWFGVGAVNIGWTSDSLDFSLGKDNLGDEIEVSVTKIRANGVTIFP